MKQSKRDEIWREADAAWGELVKLYKARLQVEKQLTKLMAERERLDREIESYRVS